MSSDLLAAPLLAVKLPKLKELVVTNTGRSTSPRMNPDQHAIRVMQEIILAAPELRKIELGGKIAAWFIQPLSLIAKLESLTLRSTCLSACRLRPTIKDVQLPHLFSVNLSGCHDFVLGCLEGIGTTTFIRLHLDISEMEDSVPVIAAIMLHRNLRHLHLRIGGWGEAIEDIIFQLDAIPHLTSLMFFADAPNGGDQPESLTESDAETICEYWPTLQVLGVAIADFDFFLSILNLQELEDLQLNAWFWPSGQMDPLDAPCPAMRSLRFNGSPPHWLAEGPAEVNRKRFPNLESLEVIPGHAGALRRPFC